MNSLEKKLEAEVEKILVILGNHRVKPRLTFLNIVHFFEFMTVFYIGFGLACFFVFMGLLKMRTESVGADTYFSLAVFMLTLLTFYIGIMYSNECFRSGVYLYEIKAKDSINEIMFLLYDYKRYKHKVKIDDVEPIELRNKLYLRIKYH